MTFHLISIFPDIFASYLNEGMLKRAQEKQLVTFKTYDLRDFTHDKHRTVDDRPYGGGAGMVLMAEPIIAAITQIKSQIISAGSKNPKIRTVLLSAKGKQWKQAAAKRYSTRYDHVIVISGRYEGVDERVKKFIDDEIAIGEYVLTGGELGALVIVDSITRLLPGVLGNAESALNESHARPNVLEHPQYTRPEVLEINGKKLRVPKVLLGGNHAEVETWREQKRKKI